MARRIALGASGAVVAGHPLAAAAGQAALAAGGGAVDACLAAAFTAWVCMPDMCGPGGDLFLLHRPARGAPVCVTGSGPAPAAFGPEVAARREALALVPGVPGALRAIEAGGLPRLPRAVLLAPAIRAAERGVVVGAMLARKLAALPAGPFRAALLAGWGVDRVAEGTVIRWPALAATLRALADGADPADLLRAALPEWRAGGALLEEADLTAAEIRLEAPLSATVAGWRLFGQTPPSGAAALLGAALRAGPDALLEPSSGYRTHMLIEATKAALGTLEGLGHAGDTAGTVAALLDAGAARAARERIGPEAAEGPDLSRNYGETTQCAAADAEGGVATLIHSLYRPFGARVLSASTGILANDRGGSFTSGANAPAPRARPRHTLVGLVAEAPDGTACALGTPGALAQTQTVLQVLANLMADPSDPEGAVLAPRWSAIGGRGVAVEAGMEEAVTRDLARRGHVLALRPPRDWLMGSLGLAFAAPSGLRGAVADDRRNALALPL
jgi:gamma-glutamyltranspeptidase/glutathione hydrolase